MFSLLSASSFGVSETVALSAVAVIGYLFGQRTRKSGAETWTESSRRELKRATSIARELEKITANVRKDLASHRATVTEFKTRIMLLSDQKQEQSWQEVCEEAEKILGPTLQLANQMSFAYDQIRQQTTQLMSFSEVRTDPLTGICNRRALEEQLDMMFAMMTRYDRTFSICIFDIDNFKALNDKQGHLHGDRALQQTAQLIDQTIRDTDIIARYGGEEFVVVMPQTTLAGACIFSDRLRSLVEEEMAITISGGTAEAVHTAIRSKRCFHVLTLRCIAQKRTVEIAFISTREHLFAPTTLDDWAIKQKRQRMLTTVPARRFSKSRYKNHRWSTAMLLVVQKKKS